MKTFLEKASEYRTSNSFKFYVPGPERLALENKVISPEPPPELLNGEIIITEAHSVLLYPCSLDKEKGILGKVFVTNFRVFFVPQEQETQKDPQRQINRLTGEYGVSLTNIDTVYQTLSGDKGRKLLPGTTISRVKGLKLVCKNMRVLNLNFEHSSDDQGKKVAKTIVHHVYPGRHSLLFAYEYSEKETADDLVEDVVMFTHREEWLDEVKRTCPLTVNNWRLSDENRKFVLSPCLPKWVVVPQSILDCDLSVVSNSFRGNRPPTWTWSCENGAALVRMADVLPAITERVQENKILENIRRSHPTKKGPSILDLDKKLPSLKDLQTSFVKLRDLCTPDTKRQFNVQDSRFFSLLEESKWLLYISQCLRLAVEAALQLRENTTVVLQEGDGRDSSAVIGSLIQLMLDPYSRTILGFQCLIQKEWVALGHPFSARLGLVRGAANVDQQSPVFLLFLDCVWQMQNQFPKAFEFSETYLTTLYDSCHVSIFDTFLFDCERDRQNAVVNKEPALQKRSVWNWNKQFSARDLTLFRNPLYQTDMNMSKQHNPAQKPLLPSCRIPNLEIWSQCYFRWLPRLIIQKGGRPQVDAIHRQLRSEIDICVTKLESLTHRSHSESFYFDWKLDKRKSNSVDSLLNQKEPVDNFYPFSYDICSSSNLLADTSAFSEYDSQSVLNLTD